eukprot:CAMPEP_0194375512 /NCGR_PEP_ID=MMETSP0174-20130528/24049_1 /TAXON_ID=216777 /ORGANISM="Proboscia alata, Strain PI-D3" /LENGTH=406 /DNA_ID=CAMNT_0039155769 /DNA_START=120 /DNA_END=1340 /DNA_ORIENTATION=-
MIVIDLLEIKAVSLQDTEDKIGRVVSSEKMKQTNKKQKVFEITHEHMFWRKGMSKLCPLLRNATNVTNLHWNNSFPLKLSEPQPLFNLVANCSQIIIGFGSGNWITGFYMVRIAASLARVDLKFQCRKGMQNHQNELLPWFTGYYRATDDDKWPLDLEPPTEEMSCTEKYNDIPLHLASYFIQSDMRRIAVAVMGDQGYDTSSLDLNMIQSVLQQYNISAAPLAPNAKLDEVAIHFRCGDVLGGAHRDDFGIIKFDEYKKQIFSDTRSIGIMTQPFDPSMLRRFDRSKTKQCKQVVYLLVDYLKEGFPNASVTIHNGANDTLPITYGRLVMANQTITSLSSFGIFPTMGTFGDGYFQKGNRGVNPFSTRVPKVLRNTHVMNAPVMSSMQIFKKGLNETIKFLITPR